MTQHGARIVWDAGGHDAPDYSRGHSWEFDGGTRVPASSSPLRVKVPMSIEAAVDPEEAFVAALSSCHMLWFLDFARRAGFVVRRYDDQALGTMEERDGRWSFRDVALRPRIAWEGRAPSHEELGDLHHRAHDACFLANSVTCEVRVESA